MNRPDAQTWSRSRVDVSADAVRFLYIEEMQDHADEAKADFEISLKRTA